MKNSCFKCKYSQQEENAQVTCRRFPPYSHVVMTQGIAGPQPAFLSAFPAVNEEMSCGEFSEKDPDTRIVGGWKTKI